MGQLETGIRDALLADPPIVAKVGTRVRPLDAGQDDARPFLTYKVTGRESQPTLAGDVSDYRKSVFEIGVYADDYDGVMDLSDLVRDRLDQFGETISGVEFAPSQFDDETDVEGIAPEGEELPAAYLRVMTFRALYRFVDASPDGEDATFEGAYFGGGYF